MPSRTLWSNLIDYAGVFPPARHPLDEALERYRRAVDHPDGWVLGPCLVRASQLESLSDPPAQLGVVMDTDGPLAPPHEVVQIELKIDPSDAARHTERTAGWGTVVYLESTEPDDVGFLDEVASVREQGADVRAKLRTGGVTADLFPSVDSVAAFIGRCVELGVPFKATAGLHHPLRRPSAVEGATEHGFMNILAAVRVALAGLHDRIGDVLAATEPAEFEFSSATWNGLGSEVPDERIRSTFKSFGSCSFSEPTGYLRQAGVLAETGS